MDFEGETVLEHLDVKDAWLILADPVSIQKTIPGCQLITSIDPDEVDFEELGKIAKRRDVDSEPLPKDSHETVEERALTEGETYGVYMEIGVAGLNLSVGAFIYVDKREYPRMEASGEGIIGDYSFEMDTGIEVEEVNGGKTKVKWWLTPEISGSLFKWGSKLANPIFKRVVNRFFQRVEGIFEDHK